MNMTTDNCIECLDILKSYMNYYIDFKYSDKCIKEFYNNLESKRTYEIEAIVTTAFGMKPKIEGFESINIGKHTRKVEPLPFDSVKETYMKVHSIKPTEAKNMVINSINKMIK